MSPTIADIQAYRLWNLSASLLDEMDRRGSMVTLPGAQSTIHDRGPRPDAATIMYLVRKYWPDSPSPDLDATFRARGTAATQADLQAHWDAERRRPAFRQPSERPAVNHDQEILDRLEEIKRLLVYLNNSRPSVAPSDGYDLDLSMFPPMREQLGILERVVCRLSLDRWERDHVLMPGEIYIETPPEVRDLQSRYPDIADSAY